MGGLAVHGLAAHGVSFGKGLLPVVHPDADVIVDIAGSVRFRNLVDLNALPEPQLPMGASPLVFRTSMSNSS